MREIIKDGCCFMGGVILLLGCFYAETLYTLIFGNPLICEWHCDEQICFLVTPLVIWKLITFSFGIGSLIVYGFSLFLHCMRNLLHRRERIC
jgi:hypothetical protein